MPPPAIARRRSPSPPSPPAIARRRHLHPLPSLRAATYRRLPTSQPHNAGFHLGGSMWRRKLKLDCMFMDKTPIPESLRKYESFLESQRRLTTALQLTAHPVAPDEVCSAVIENPDGSRFGGAALVSQTYPWPSDYFNEPMFHLAQLNLSKLPAREGYPTSGLLQFFVADDGLMGLGETDDGSGFFGSVVRYIPDHEIPSMVLAYHHPQNCAPISNGYFTVTGRLYHQLPHSGDEQFSDLYDPEKQLFAGGWPFFIQDDPRPQPSPTPDENLELLLQIDDYADTKSPVTIRWGDAGVAHFFISPAALRNRDFRNVFYTWSCF
ncbi:MAG: YwqG family protein [Corynebacterium sp.]|nr:YwqG family protein [Corynebacterium sp.]